MSFPITIEFETQDKKTVTLKGVTPTQTVGQLKDLIGQQTGTRPKELYEFQTQLTDDSATLGSYGLKQGRTHYLHGEAADQEPTASPDGGRRRRKSYKMPRKMSRKYCKKTPCKKMGFTQRSSCRPYKNCFTRRVRRAGL